jgi:hypothetical protein
MPVTIGGRGRRGRQADPPSAAAELLYGKLVELVAPLDIGQRMEFATAIGDGVAFEDLSPELAELLGKLSAWATRRLVR